MLQWTCRMIHIKLHFKVLGNMKVPKDYDVVSKGAPSFSKGTSMEDYKGVQPEESAIKMTPGEKETNNPAVENTNKKQPFGPGGSGYTKGS